MDSDGYVDLQVNGYAGVDFNAEGLTEEKLRLLCDALRRDGVTAILATIITDHEDVMIRRIARVVELVAKDAEAAKRIVGIHVEGPFLSPEPGFRGAHPADAIKPASADSMGRLLDAGQGSVRLVTLAPEQDADCRVISMLAKQGIIVSAGHTNAPMDQLRKAVDAGLRLFTHLGNGCPMKGMDRHDNIIQRALNLAAAGLITPCFIADGVHVPFMALSNYLRCVGPDRCIVVSDAMAAAGLGPGRHRLGRWEVDVGEDLAAWAPDRTHLVGSAMSMKRAGDNLSGLGLSETVVRSLVSTMPSKLLGLSG